MVLILAWEKVLCVLHQLVRENFLSPFFVSDFLMSFLVTVFGCEEFFLGKSFAWDGGCFIFGIDFFCIGFR